MPKTTGGVVGCKGCGAEIFFAKTAAGKMMPLDAAETKIVQTEEVDGESTVKETLIGHQPHHVTRPKAGDFKKGSGQARSEAAKPEGTTEQDACKVCDSKTSYREWTPDGTTKVLQFWDCTKMPSCGKWWNTQGSGYTPRWKDATPEQKEKQLDREADREGEQPGSEPF